MVITIVRGFLTFGANGYNWWIAAKSRFVGRVLVVLEDSRVSLKRCEKMVEDLSF